MDVKIHLELLITSPDSQTLNIGTSNQIKHIYSVRFGMLEVGFFAKATKGSSANTFSFKIVHVFLNIVILCSQRCATYVSLTLLIFCRWLNSLYYFYEYCYNFYYYNYLLPMYYTTSKPFFN